MKDNSIRQTLYEILRVSQTATLEEIKIAYRRMAIEYHPDINPGANNKACHEMMCKINEAYRVLRDAETRKLYDQTLKENSQKPYSCNVDKSSKTKNSKTSTTEYKNRTYEEISYNYDSVYEYYNSVDFDENTQQDFIDWIYNFSYRYIKLVYDYYKELNINGMSMLNNLYTDFNNIIKYEKDILKLKSRKKTKKSKSL